MKINTENMRDKIIRLCKTNPKLADDDKRLIANIWWGEGWHDTELYEKLKSVSSPETIRRTRAKLVQEGVITPSEQATEARYHEYEKAMDAVGNPPALFY